MIKNYINVVRRYIVADSKLIQICNEIYNKHKEALNIIFDNVGSITKFISSLN